MASLMVTFALVAALLPAVLPAPLADELAVFAPQPAKEPTASAAVKITAVVRRSLLCFIILITSH